MEIPEKIKKVYELVKRGTENERKVAEQKLKVLMEKYNISEDELDETNVECEWFKYKNKMQRKLLIQITYAVLGDVPLYGNTLKRRHIGAYCTKAQKIEIEFMLDFYYRAFCEDIDIFMSAFIQKNKIFPPPELVKAEASEGLTEKDLRMLQIASGLEKHERLKCLNEKNV